MFPSLWVFFLDRPIFVRKGIHSVKPVVQVQHPGALLTNVVASLDAAAYINLNLTKLGVPGASPSAQRYLPIPEDVSRRVSHADQRPLGNLA